jgi:hypothetical protein
MKRNKLKILIIIILIILLTPIKGKASFLPYQLKGKFLIQVEEKGTVWYVDNKNTLRHRISNESEFFHFLSNLGTGISNANLAKIPIAVNDKLILKDTDSDGLDDKLEKAIGTNPYKPDSDGDGFFDGLEIKNHFDPLGPGRLSIDLDFASSLSGQLLLQVENNGEVWYVNSKDNLRYYIPNYLYFLNIIKLLGTGINNQNLNNIVKAEKISQTANKKIKIDTTDKQKLDYYLDDNLIGSFLISSGKASTPTPKGNFHIINKHKQAWSPLGLWMPYWLGLGTGRFGLHELPFWPNGYREGENHLGVAVSGGCIRLGIGPAQWLYNWTEVGTPVIIY